ncbi:hypothetical protein SAMN04488057_103286 [Cyclobacterium lianum]|uniref:Uncharacterized protein n=1 Tax=Cyclobacterium lianum TaxID=388280 RepID=A0A1M7LJ73_9BACT|nr:hypothetical protein [Cyclobacterium lianum]SHM77598.1 hypothetical protein SAMN04488057_103286 [Cyclobacterium lianum]
MKKAAHRLSEENGRSRPVENASPVCYFGDPDIMEDYELPDPITPAPAKPKTR